MPEHKEHVTKIHKKFPPIVMETPTGQGIVPKTDFGRDLLALRKQAIADGMKLRSAEEILTEIEESRRPL